MCNFLFHRASESLPGVCRFFTLTVYAGADLPITLRDEMIMRHPTKVHEHVAKRVHVLMQRAGVPYEIEQQVCADCSRVLDEKPVKRATA